MYASRYKYPISHLSGSLFPFFLLITIFYTALLTQLSYSLQYCVISIKRLHTYQTLKLYSIPTQKRNNLYSLQTLLLLKTQHLKNIDLVIRLRPFQDGTKYVSVDDGPPNAVGLVSKQGSSRQLSTLPLRANPRNLLIPSRGLVPGGCEAK